MGSPETELEEFAPLNITCKSTDCRNNLHCFQKDKQGEIAFPGDKCRACGIELVDWSRVQKRDKADLPYTFSMLRIELIRHKYWHREFTEREQNTVRRKGRSGMRVVSEKRIRASVAKKEPYNDGRQTPWDGKIIYYAQHATATCCRTCIAEWHGIPTARELTPDEIGYLAELVCLYIFDRMPDLAEEGIRIPAIRRKKPSSEE